MARLTKRIHIYEGYAALPIVTLTVVLQRNSSEEARDSRAVKAMRRWCKDNNKDTRFFTWDWVE